MGLEYSHFVTELMRNNTDAGTLDPCLRHDLLMRSNTELMRNSTDECTVCMALEYSQTWVGSPGIGVLENACGCS
jgi:hypothetical protein